MQRQLSCILCLGAVGLTVSAALGLQEDPAQGESQGLAATTFLSWSETDLSGRLMDGAHRFVERQIDESIEKRRSFWRLDFSSLDAYERSIKANRTRFGVSGEGQISASPVRMGDPWRVAASPPIKT